MRRPRRVRRTPPPAYGTSENRSSLLEKYEALVRRCEALQERHRKHAARQSSSAVFALAAMRSPVTGIAFVHDDAIRARNLRFSQLERLRTGWRQAQGGPAVPMLAAVVLALSARIEERGGPRTITERYERVGGDQIVDVRVERIGTVGSGLKMATVVGVTESVRAAQELEAARKLAFEQERLRAVGELASGVAHDFNNTLNAMSLWIARLGQSAARGPGDQRAIDALARIVSDAAVRVGRLQDFSRCRSDVPEESLSVEDVVRQAVEVCRSELEGNAQRSGLIFRMDTRIASDLPRVRGSGAELRHVFLNLLLNARDAMPRGGTVVIGAARDGDQVVVEVADEGTGIPDEHLSRVFDPFFTTKGNRGTGLGLSIAYRVMERLGGSISAANRPRGGAVFRLAFPVVDAAEAAPASPPEAHPSRSGKSVLVIDDEPDNLDAMRQVLEGMGQKVTTVPSGGEALERLRDARFDLVLCDVGMPDMNGWQVAEHIREVAPGTPVYMVTGWAKELAPDDPHLELIEGVLPKPIELETLARVVYA
jgi:signal transduction histidine kinase